MSSTRKSPSRKRLATRFGSHRKLSVTTLWTLFFSAILATMLAALTYLYSQFPVSQQQINVQKTSSNHIHIHQPNIHKEKTLQKLRARHNEDPSLLEGASADGAEAELAFLPKIKAKNPPRIFTCRCYPMVKYAFATRGFSMKRDEHDYQDSWMIWKTGTDIKVQELEAWQRPNHFPGERTMDRKGAMFDTLRKYSMQHHSVSLDFLPETFLLYQQTDKERFLERLQNKGGMDLPWVLKQTKASRGRGVTILGPQSTELMALRDDLINVPIKPRHIVQSYIKNEWTYQGHKCDLRVYVLVASVDPLIVYYHDGILRTAAGVYDADNFEESKAHLTNVSQNKANRTLWEPVKTFQELEQELETYTAREEVVVEFEDRPIDHIRSQIKEILGVVFAAFRNHITLENWPVDNAFALMGADFVIDQDLKVWLLEMQLGPQLVGDNHNGKIALLQDVLTTSIDVVEEVFHKQARDEPLLPLAKTRNFELVYSDEFGRFQSGGE